MTHQLTDGWLLNDTVVFCRTLRDRGLLATPSEATDAGTVLVLMHLDDRGETFFGLRGVFTPGPEDFPVFEEASESFWAGRAEVRSPGRLSSAKAFRRTPGSLHATM